MTSLKYNTQSALKAETHKQLVQDTLKSKVNWLLSERDQARLLNEEITIKLRKRKSFCDGGLEINQKFWQTKK